MSRIGRFSPATALVLLLTVMVTAIARPSNEQDLITAQPGPSSILKNYLDRQLNYWDKIHTFSTERFLDCHFRSGINGSPSSILQRTVFVRSLRNRLLHNKQTHQPLKLARKYTFKKWWRFLGSFFTAQWLFDLSNIVTILLPSCSPYRYITHRLSLPSLASNEPATTQ